MRFVFTDEQNKFRQEIRDFLKSELDAGTFSVDVSGLVGGPDQEFSRKMAEKGWIGITWPKKYGGQGRTYVEKMILIEECLRVKAPIGYHFSADRQVGPALMAFGSDWQKDFFLPKIIKAEDGMQFCLLFSEPNAGSDLAAVTTKAVKEGDYYIINGQKVWTSAGHVADFGWMLARTNTDSSVRGHLACSEFMIDMKSPGITVRPIINIAGAHSFNEVFFDDVKIHKKYLVGEENGGFKQIMAQMDYERAGIERLMQNYPLFEQLKNHVKEMDKDKDGGYFYAWVRDQVAQLEIEYNIGRLLCYNTAWVVDQGQKPSSQAALTKAYCTQYEQRLNDVATKIMGPVSQIKQGAPWAAFDGDLAACNLWGPSYTLQGGSVEVLKNIIALRGLGLPRK
ncbi:MAG: acyl-CoA dehydrogenase family protein [Deltaproteobacteria bacterium]|nr:acyl-CoA dehydrogenase family protein [Deltaproteobacteria bacterium]MBW2053102.1 acyl-CoA dehydrogenase family protein [Deltaproteobacteria bacterium]MBW2141983.1 acyl-CoA dehydrogenase family protein [Deltaproteobacteria bacterium]MBW2323973.1 acyl-CoA dehydrogenase family protein [Deltaproteobacteria bacterium]